MAQPFIDLDEVISSDLLVVVAGVEHRLPGDAPAELLLRLSMLAEKIEKGTDEPEEMLTLREEFGAELEQLFRVRQPDLPEGAINLTDAQAAILLSKLFDHYFQLSEGGERPTSPTTEAAKPPKPSPSRRRSAAARSKAAASSTSSQT